MERLFSTRQRRLLQTLLALLIALTLAPRLATAQPANDVVRVVVLSNRADLVSGGDALVEIVLPAGADPNALEVDVNGRSVADAFAVRPALDGRLVGYVEGLAHGTNVLTARLPDGRGARITITNHPRGGPIFSGPQIEPWVCTTEENGLGPAEDEDCNAPTIYQVSYKDALTGRFADYDPDNPPPDSRIATATTDEGETVPYIVRTERGTLDRGIYDIAVLFDPNEPWEPWAPQRGWNGKLSFLFGSACNPGHSQADAVDARNDMMLSRGFAVGASSVNVFGNVCNFHIAAEALMMIKERLVEGYGEVRYTIGNGCSGGSEAQNSIAENYPGLLDGILPTCTFADAWTPAIYDKFDCPLFTRYFTQTSPHLWGDARDRQAVLGGNFNESICAEQEAFAPAVWDPTTGCGLPAEQTYDPQSNPTGTRCTLQDYHATVLGRRPSDGFANGINDHVGRQWGLAALQAGQISTAQFVDLNEKLGGFDLDFQWQAERTKGDLPGIERMYRTGQLTYGQNLDRVASIDVRTDDTYDFHSNIHRYILRARMVRSLGHHDTQVFWFETQPGPFGIPSPAMATRSFEVLDEWLAAVEADTTDDPLEVKLVRNKPEAARDGCFTGGQRNDQDAVCNAAHSDNLMPRIVAGEPLTADVLKCQLKPLNPADYRKFNIEFTGAEWERLQAAFPDGVCDYSRPSVGHQAPVAGAAWLTLQDGPGGRPLGPPPASQPLEPFCRDVAPLTYADRDKVLTVHRHSVACATALKIVRGFANDTYRPGAPVRRDQMASFVAQTLDTSQTAQKLPAAEASRHRFGDISQNAHLANINRLFAAGIVGGRTATQYAPHDPVTRAQMATFLLRSAEFAAGLEKGSLDSGEPGFGDVHDTNAHYATVNGASQQRLVLGKTPERYDPAAYARRDQMATFILRLLSLIDS